MKNIILLILIAVLGLVFVLPWWGAEEEPQQMQPLPIYNTSKNSGIYKGVLPCADCAGIETTLQLNSDGTYDLTQNYSGKGTFVETGKWTKVTQPQIKLIELNEYYDITPEGNLFPVHKQQSDIPQMNSILTKQPGN